jgi:uncharacterized protein
MVAEKTEIVQQVRKLTEALKKRNVIIIKAILFGSYAAGIPREDSDIDVAFISSNFEGIRFIDRKMIIPDLIHYDCRFDVHPYPLADFNNNGNWFVQEIKKTGWEIPLQ